MTLLTCGVMRAVLLVLLVGVGFGTLVHAHSSGSAITWNREVSRIVYEKCATCHRPEGSAFSLMSYRDVQPRANEIKESVLARRMPPWGAVKGFGQFRNDQSLSQEQIELITKWVDGGIRRGNNPNQLPQPPTFKREPSYQQHLAARVSGPWTVDRPFTLDGLLPQRVGAPSMQIVAILPTGKVQPLIWLRGYDVRHPQPFLLRRPLYLPAGTEIRGISNDAVVLLLAQPSPRT